MKKILFTLIAWQFGLLAFAQRTDELLNQYMQIKNALVNSNSQRASSAINGLYESVKNEDYFKQKASLLKATEKLNNAGTSLEKQRAVFNEVSVVMWQLIKSSNKINQPVYYQYCPMKKTYWLSMEKEIKNPYFGSTMLSCGKMEATNK